MIDKRKEIVIERISSGSLLKMLLMGFGLSLGPLILLIDLLRLLEGKAVFTVNDAPVTGVSLLLVSLLVAPLFGVLFSSVISWLFLLVGHRICAEVGWRIRLRCTSIEDIPHI